MKHDELRAITHNIADSLASGTGLMIGVYCTDVFEEARRSGAGFIDVDFLAGTAGGGASAALSDAVRLYAHAFEQLCRRHAVPVTVFREVMVRYSSTRAGNRFTVTLKDEGGRWSVTDYTAWPGARLKEIDEQGRLRPRRVVRGRHGLTP